MLESPAEVIEALNKVSDYDFADCKTAFESIRVQNGFVYFCLSDETYALVFSSDNQPKQLRETSGAKRIYTKEIGEGWYHMQAEAVEV